MKLSLVIIIMSLASCPSSKPILDESQKTMILELSNILNEDKFLASANGWKGYTGCKNEIERIAYSKNINECIKELMHLIKSNKPEEILRKTLIKYKIISMLVRKAT